MACVSGADPLVGHEVGALGRHIALIGFMGAGKSTVGREVAAATARPFVDLDEEIERLHGPIAAIFDERGEAEFRRLEEERLAHALAGEPAVLALGGGAVLRPGNVKRLRAQAFTVQVNVGVDVAWERSRGSDRPLARDESDFRRLFAERASRYAEAADAVAVDAEGVLLAALGVAFDEPVEVAGPAAVIADERVLGLHGAPLSAGVIPVPAGEAAKEVSVAARLWTELELGRDGTVVGLGGGSTTDLAGFVAATHLRGIAWLAVPTTLTGMVDAAIGGKTGVNTAAGKNLVGAFHFPRRVHVHARYLTTLPEAQRRAGMAEVVKTGLLAGRDVWTRPEEEMIRACAAYKSGVVLADPYETEGRRAVLNLGHTFAHALEAGSGYTVAHGDAVALGLRAALRLSGQPTDVVDDLLAPKPVSADREAAWAAVKRDKKGEGVFILLEAPGKPVVTAVAEADARRALDELIA